MVSQATIPALHNYLGVFNVSENPDDFMTNLFLARADSTGQQQLTSFTDRTVSRSPDWSPDNRQLAFTTFNHNNQTHELYVMAIDGTNLRLLFTSPNNIQQAQWSPDSTSILVNTRAFTPSEMYTINVNSGTQTHLATHPMIYRPQWSPDGQSIYYHVSDDQNSELWRIFAMNPDGTNVRPITAENTITVFYKWLDGGAGFIAKTGGNYYRFAADGSNPSALTTESDPVYLFSLAPDGRSFVYTASDEPGGAIQTLYLQTIPLGTRVPIATNLCLDAKYCSASPPVWSPSQTQIAFTQFDDRAADPAQDEGLWLVRLFPTPSLPSGPIRYTLVNPAWLGDDRYLVAQQIEPIRNTFMNPLILDLELNRDFPILVDAPRGWGYDEWRYQP